VLPVVHQNEDRERRQEQWSGILSDIRHGMRLFSKTPGFTAIVILTIALGIGLNTAMFSITNAMLIRPLPYAAPDRIAMVWNAWPQKGFPRMRLFNPEYLDIQRNNHVFSETAGLKLLSANVTGGGDPERLDGDAAGNDFGGCGPADRRGGCLRCNAGFAKSSL
jgi:hypothetical protein